MNLLPRALTARPLRSAGPVIIACLLVASLFSGAVFTALAVAAERETEALALELETSARSAVEVMEGRLDGAVSDVLFIAQAPATVALGTEMTAEAKSAAAETFAALAANESVFEDVRYIGLDDREVVRVVSDDGEIEQIPEHALDDLSAYDVSDFAAGIDQGEVFVSPFELVKDDGAVVRPLHPIVRIATPAFDAGGARAGTVIVTVDGAMLIDRLRRYFDVGQHIYLVDGAGEWLVGERPDTSWTATLGGDGLADQHPVSWQAISATGSGQHRGEEGLYGFAAVHPGLAMERLDAERRGAKEPHGSASDRAEAWTAVGFVPTAALPSAGITRHPEVFAAYLAGLVVLLGVTALITQLLIGRQSLRRSVRQTATRLEAIRDTLGDGLIVVDSQGRITDTNPESGRMLGWSREEMLGRSSHELFHSHPEHLLAAEECPMLAVARSGATFRSEDEVFECRDGSALHVGASAAPLIVDGRVEGAVIVFHDITEIRAYQEEIRRLAYRDELTGLPNRRVFADRLDLAMGSADRRSAAIAVMFLDLDGFKGVNDDYGHVVGDEFLRQVARRIRESLRASDTLARHGGDEFVVLLSEIEGREEAEAVARRILDGLQEPFVIDGFTLRAATSIGVAMRLDGECADTLVANADAAMYAAKEMGPNHYCVSGRAPVEMS